MSYRINCLPNKIGGNNENKSVIVFVHGLGGGRETWLELSNFLNQNWSEDFSFDVKYYHPYNERSIFNRLFVFLKESFPLGSYFLFLYRVIVGEGIDVLAKGLDSYLEVNCYNYDNIMLVGHSMGGLISRKMLVDQLEKKHFSEVDKLLTYASPHIGSHLANMFGFTLQIRQMNFFKSKFLESLNSLWYSLSAKDHVNPTYVIATKDKIVNSDSASGIDVDPHIVYAIGQSHSSLIKPNNIDDIGYSILLKCIFETFIEVELSSMGALDGFVSFGDDDDEITDDLDDIPGIPDF